MPKRIPTEAANPNGLAARFIAANGIDRYRREYEAGWRDGPHGSAKYSSGQHTDAYEDGYLDAACDRPKWHFLRCTKVDNHNGCEA